MRKYLIIYIVIIMGILVSLGFVFAKIEKDSDNDGLSDREELNVYTTSQVNSDTDADGFIDGVEVVHGYSPVKKEPVKLNQLVLDVPYVNEAPDNNWTGPWKNACEEASMTMIEKYYLGQTTVSVTAAKNFMSMLFAKQNAIWGTNSDSDTKRTAKLINDYSVANAKIMDNPTIEQIKTELNQKRPVISFHYGFDLHNSNIPFVPAPRGTSYHVLVVKGYDDETKEFIVNDTGDRKEGNGYRYDYELFMDSLHDFDFSVRKANGPARVVFTYPKLVKTKDSHRIYYIHDNIKQYVTAPRVFAQKKWSWDAVNVVEQQWLDTFVKGDDLK